MGRVLPLDTDAAEVRERSWTFGVEVRVVLESTVAMLCYCFTHADARCRVFHVSSASCSLAFSSCVVVRLFFLHLFLKTVRCRCATLRFPTMWATLPEALRPSLCAVVLDAFARRRFVRNQQGPREPPWSLWLVVQTEMTKHPSPVSNVASAVLSKTLPLMITTPLSTVHDDSLAPQTLAATEQLSTHRNTTDSSHLASSSQRTPTTDIRHDTAPSIKDDPRLPTSTKLTDLRSPRRNPAMYSLESVFTFRLCVLFRKCVSASLCVTDRRTSIRV